MWRFEQTLRSPQSYRTMAFDGYGVWGITSTNAIHYIPYWSDEAMVDPEHLDISRKMTHSQPLWDVQSIEINQSEGCVALAGTVLDSVYYSGHVYILTTDGVYMLDVTRRQLVRRISLLNSALPYEPRILVVGGHIFMLYKRTQLSLVNRGNILARRVLTSTEWTTTDIPGMGTSNTLAFADSLNNSVIITNPAANSVVEIDADSLATRRSRTVVPDGVVISVNQDREVLVASEAGAVYRWRYDADVIEPYSSFGSPTLTSAVRIYDDGRGNFWAIGAPGGLPPLTPETDPAKTEDRHITRLTKSNRRLRIYHPFVSRADVPAFYWSDSRLPPDANRKVLSSVLTPQFTVRNEDGSLRTIRPYLFVSFNTGTTLIFRLTSMIRVNSLQVRGTAMVSTGTSDYIGG